jgi:hypothetical protein
MDQEQDATSFKVPADEPRTRGVRISDVAAAAGVSVTTVSNVLNKPHKVRRETRTLVSKIMRDLKYVPNAHAVALRQRDKTGPEPTRPKQDTTTTHNPLQQAQQEVPNLVPEGWNELHEGDRVEIVRFGRNEGHAVIESFMPDRTALWLWMADGMGRSMVLSGDDVHIRLVPKES